MSSPSPSYTRQQLEDMKYQDLRTFAKTYDVRGNGKQKIIVLLMARLESTSSNANELRPSAAEVATRRYKTRQPKIEVLSPSASFTKVKRELSGSEAPRTRSKRQRLNPDAEAVAAPPIQLPRLATPSESRPAAETTTMTTQATALQLVPTRAPHDEAGPGPSSSRLQSSTTDSHEPQINGEGSGVSPPQVNGEGNGVNPPLRTPRVNKSAEHLATVRHELDALDDERAQNLAKICAIEKELEDLRDETQKSMLAYHLFSHARILFECLYVSRLKRDPQSGKTHFVAKAAHDAWLDYVDEYEDLVEDLPLDQLAERMEEDRDLLLCERKTWSSEERLDSNGAGESSRSVKRKRAD